MEVIQSDKNYSISKHVNYLGLKEIVKAILNVDLDKFFQQADWRVRPLPSGMLDYARSDSHYLIPIYIIFVKILQPLSFEKSESKEMEAKL